jgi:hypothetical protein
MSRRAPFACLLAVLLLVAGCGGSPASGGDDDPASAVPSDAAMYFDATVRPEGSQRDDALAAAGKVLATPDPQAKIDALIQKALSQSDGLKLDYARDIKPWLGAKAGFWLAAARGQETRGAAVLSSTDEDAARAALDRAVKGSGQTFTKRSYKGVDYQVNQDGGAAAVDGGFVVLGSEPELKRTLETLDGGKSLAGDDRYENAADELDSKRLGTLYFDVKALYDAAAASDPQAAQQLQQLRRVVPLDSIGPVSAAFTANGNQLAVDGVIPGGRDFAERYGAFSGTGSTPLLGEVPGDSWIALGVPKLGESARKIFQQVAGALGGAAIDQQLHSQLGLDLNEDVFSWIGDVAFFARGTSDDTVDGGAVIQVTDEERAKAAFGKLVGLAQSHGAPTAKPVSVPGAETAFEFAQAGPQKPIVAARGKGRVVIAYGSAAAADALTPKQKLADSPTFEQAKSLLGDGYEPGFVLSMPALVALAQSGDSDHTFAEAKPYLEAFSVIASGGKLDGDTARSRVVAGLK